MKNILLLCASTLVFMNCKTSVKEKWEQFPEEINLSEYNHLDYVKIKKGQTLLVKVNENPSTGYSWKTETEKDCVVGINEGTYQQDEAPEGIVGVGGLRTYEVKGNDVGTCLIEFKNFPPAAETPSEKKSIYFTVE